MFFSFIFVFRLFVFRFSLEKCFEIVSLVVWHKKFVEIRSFRIFFFLPLFLSRKEWILLHKNIPFDQHHFVAWFSRNGFRKKKFVISLIDVHLVVFFLQFFLFFPKKREFFLFLFCISTYSPNTYVTKNFRQGTCWVLLLNCVCVFLSEC